MQSITNNGKAQGAGINCAPELEDAFLSWIVYQPELRLVYNWLPAAAFVQPAARAVWGRIQDGSADLPMLFAELGDKHWAYLHQIAQVSNFTCDMPGWADKIFNLYSQREIYRIAIEAIALSQKPQLNPSNSIQDIIAKLNNIQSLNTCEKSLKSHGEASEQFIRGLAEAAENGNPSRFLWGWKDLDNLTGGLLPGQLISIGARSSMGKSTFALNAACNLAEAGTPTLFISLEMSVTELEAKMLSRTARVPTTEFRDPAKISEATLDKLVDRSIAETSWPLYLDDGQYHDASDIEVAILKCQNHHGQKPSVVFVDYLQLMSLDAGNEANMTQAVSRLTRSLKQLARKLDVVIVILSQLNRGVEARQDKRPVMSDFRDSGSIEQDSNLIIMLYRDAYYNPNTELGNITEVIIPKNRGGATGKVEMVFDGTYSDFKSKC